MEARTALALCAACPVRAECLEFAMRHWRSVGRHGIWGGLVEAERTAAHRRWAAGLPVETPSELITPG
jgi:WhiB family redox-sensing transcriptional regulator